MRQRAVQRAEDKPEWVTPSAPARPPASALMRLQQTAGNRAVAQLLQSGGNLVHTLAEPSPASFDDIQAMRPGSSFVTGATSMPDGSFKAPRFDMGATSAGGADPAGLSWACRPTWIQHYDEGNSECVYLEPGRHRTSREENGKPVFIHVSRDVSKRIQQGEAEHAGDIKRARDLSIREAENVLAKHVIGKTFTAPTREEAEQQVLDRILGRLTHPELGNDQSTWGDTYRKLYEKTAERDTNGWHTFTQAFPKHEDGAVTYEVVDRTKIGANPPRTFISY